ncbi:MAG TPA: cytochrome P450 [Roseiflexaceae bacterium]|nr:cytochrome P450 [Roseiflexaceae bacterium]
MTTLRDFNHLASPHLEDPYPLYAQARGGPVFFAPVFQCWVVTRYQDVLAALSDPKRFSSHHLFRTPVDPTPEVEAVLAQIPPEEPLLVTEDPPSHTRTRALVAKALSPRRYAAMEPRIQAIADELVDGFATAGEADLVGQYGFPLPMRVLLEFIGLPPEDAPFVKRWAHEHMQISMPGLDPQLQLQIARTEVEFSRYAAGVIADRRAHPRDDVLSGLINARVDGERPFDESELITLLQHLLTAGHETTTCLIANTLLNLLREPERWRAVCDDPATAGAAAEEGLRYDAPVQGMFRVTTGPVELSGAELPTGARVLLLFGAANRDAAVFAEPDRFDPARPNAHKHLGLGYGIHYCIGAPLARAEARIAVATLARRLPGLRLAPSFAPAYLPNLIQRALRGLPVVWEA